MIFSEAHATMRTMHQAKTFELRGLSLRLGIHPQSLLYILTGSVPKVTLAVGIERELGIPIADWTVPHLAAPSETNDLKEVSQ